MGWRCKAGGYLLADTELNTTLPERSCNILCSAWFDAPPPQKDRLVEAAVDPLHLDESGPPHQLHQLVGPNGVVLRSRHLGPCSPSCDYEVELFPVVVRPPAHVRDGEADRKPRSRASRSARS